MDLSGPIILCGRSTNDTVRGYNGRITHLALFDQAITPLEAYAIYNQVTKLYLIARQLSQPVDPEAYISSTARQLCRIASCCLSGHTSLSA